MVKCPSISSMPPSSPGLRRTGTLSRASTCLAVISGWPSEPRLSPLVTLTSGVPAVYRGGITLGTKPEGLREWGKNSGKLL